MPRRSLILLWGALLIMLGSCGKQAPKVEETPIDTIPTMVTQVQKTSKLYTSEYHLHKIVTYDDSLSINGSFLNKRFSIGLPMGRRRLAIPLTATVKAYVDMSKFSEANIKRNGDKLEIVLPDPELLMTSTQIDHAEIKRKVSFFRKNFSDAEITRIQQQGRNDMLRSLPNLDIIENARQNAARQLIPIFEEMGFAEQNITITFRKNFTLSDFPTLIKKTE